MRILRVADVEPGRTAGVSGLMLATAEQMAALGHEVVFWFRPDLSPALRHPGLRRLLVPLLIAFNVLLGALRGERFDVVEVHEPLGTPYALLSRLVRVLPPCVVLSYGPEARAWRARRAWESWAGDSVSLRSRILVPATLLSQARVALDFASAVAVPSTEDRRHLIEARSLDRRRVVRCSTGVSEELFALAPRRSDQMGALFLGSWLERKGVSVLRAAWCQLAAGGAPAARLTLAGVGAAPAARSFAPGQEHVQVIPRFSRSELAELLAAHDVFVLPSWFEGMPLSLLEAAAAGLAARYRHCRWVGGRAWWVVKRDHPPRAEPAVSASALGRRFRRGAPPDPAARRRRARAAPPAG